MYYSDPILDAPPPTSQLEYRRRPWSPDPLFPSSSTNALGGEQYTAADDLIPRSHLRPRREASDVSVEALDLADYARTLRARQAEDPYPAFPSQLRQVHHPPSSYPTRPHPVGSRDSFEQHPPSLVSRGPTLSSTSTHHTLSSNPPSQGRRTTRRPFSLPNTPVASQASSSRGHLPPSSYKNPRIFEAGGHPTSSDEIDISNFPKWSRGWYDSNNSSPKYNTPTSNVSRSFDPNDNYTPIPLSRLDSAKGKGKSIFDPGYNHSPFDTYGHDTYDPYDPPPPVSSIGHESSRNLLPWSTDPPEYGPPLDPLLKEERMRMLEREFGTNAKKKDQNVNPWVDEEGKPLVGTVDKSGNLVTAGPKKRVFVRSLQIILALGAAIPAIYAAAAIKSTDPRDPPPPPANKPPAYVLYVLSSLTLVLLLYLFVARPCCCGRRKTKSNKNAFPAAGNMGMMVLPVGGPGKKGKKDKSSKKGGGKYGPPGQDVQVNLIVDPTAFQPTEESDTGSEGEYDEEAMPGSYEERQHTRRRKRNRRRRGVFEGLAMEADWKVARSWLKKIIVIDIACVVLWGAAFVFIMIGQRCPIGEFDGWCNAYNVSTASACLLCVAFGVSIFFDVQDLHASKQSPRTRT
ncbi:hypothetical protein CVT24_006794 [Panaeolus cyanescens]|uniref:Uncharacterized protein n=1 Tax=Panaeolus cyanescens TaxID=181874 RepID=A0A409VBF7_9AGAR|nr:hypothetical protein CVT24_006794 [Panaeolus cyanescens]